eukprot:67231_1
MTCSMVMKVILLALFVFELDGAGRAGAVAGAVAANRRRRRSRERRRSRDSQRQSHPQQIYVHPQSQIGAQVLSTPRLIRDTRTHPLINLNNGTKIDNIEMDYYSDASGASSRDAGINVLSPDERRTISQHLEEQEEDQDVPWWSGYTKPILTGVMLTGVIVFLFVLLHTGTSN